MSLEEQVTIIRHGNPFYPPTLVSATDTCALGEFWATGPTELLMRPKVGFFCSSQFPGSIVLKTFDAITRMRGQGQMLIGGFHSVMEWECLRILLRGHQPIIWIPCSEHRRNASEARRASLLGIICAQTYGLALSCNPFGS